MFFVIVFLHFFFRSSYGTCKIMFLKYIFCLLDKTLVLSLWGFVFNYCFKMSDKCMQEEHVYNSGLMSVAGTSIIVQLD